MAENGSVIELSRKTVKIADSVQAGRVFVDGSGVGDVGSVVLRDRKHLAEDGMIAVALTALGPRTIRSWAGRKSSPAASSMRRTARI